MGFLCVITPDAVLTGFAFNLGRRYFFHWSGIAAIISTSRGWEPSLNFFADLDFKAFKFTLWFCSCAEMSSRAISAQALARFSFCEYVRGSVQIFLCGHEGWLLRRRPLWWLGLNGDRVESLIMAAARLSDVSTECVADTLGAQAFSHKFKCL